MSTMTYEQSEQRWTPEEQAQHREAWVAALRSGEYKQGKGQLYKQREDAYCCLGVACDLAAAKVAVGGKEVWAPYGNLPEMVADYYGITMPGCLTGGERPAASLVELNDDLDYSFTQIADVIEDGYLLSVTE